MKVTKISLNKFKKYNSKEINIPDGFCLIAGTNNSGKSTFMQAFSLWEFCKSVIEMEQGRAGLMLGEKSKQGIGINSEEFLPINLPSLKHLWTNLKFTPEIKKEDLTNKKHDGYTLWIETEWETKSKELKHLRFSLALTNERLFIKTSKSNIGFEEPLPKIAYIPPFAGILNKEQFNTKAVRSKLIGQGLSGSVMRNTLLELHRKNHTTRTALKGDRSKIKTTDLKELRANDPWEHLLDVCRKLFNIELIVHDFNEEYHNHIRVEYWKGSFDEARKFKKHPSFSNRDIMVEGSGLLQFLNVVSLALDPQYDVIVLDKPDAHLHPSLQRNLNTELINLAQKYKKQIMLATHSTELIKTANLGTILKFEKSDVDIVNTETQRTTLITGLGNEYHEKIEKVISTKRIFFCENQSDFNLLNKLSKGKLNTAESQISTWPTTDTHAERLKTFKTLSDCIKGIKAISLRDRDMLHHNDFNNDLSSKGLKGRTIDFTDITWRYRYIESYLLNPNAIAKCANKEPKDIVDLINSEFSINISNLSRSEIDFQIRDIESKEIFSYLKRELNIDKHEIAYAIDTEEIHADIIFVIDAIEKLIS